MLINAVALRWQKKTLETLHELWYIEHKEEHLLVAGVP